MAPPRPDHGPRAAAQQLRRTTDGTSVGRHSGPVPIQGTQVFTTNLINCSLLSPALNRSREFASRPGVCPKAGQEASTSPCALDSDCPGLQKCCPLLGGHRCVAPAPQGRTEVCSKGGIQLGSCSWAGVGPDLVKVGGAISRNPGRCPNVTRSPQLCAGHLPLPLNATSLSRSGH